MKFMLVGLAAAGGLVAAVVMLAGLGAASRPAEAGGLGYPLDDVGVVTVTTGLDQPVDIAFTGIATDTRMFVVERAGRIRVVVSGTVLATPFLSITGQVRSTDGEEGLLGLAFAPDYATSGQFYVHYVNLPGDLQVSRFQVSADPNVALTTETSILNIPHPTCNNHNGGDLSFGLDGYLYIGPGDGGGADNICVPGTLEDDAQRLDSLLGKLLRINVSGVPTYTIPASNPFTQTAGARPEIWAWGLRNPWRFSFDAVTGELYIGDVGQARFEEINLQPAGSAGGENYGWRCYEANAPNVTTGCGPASDYVFPVFAIERALGRAVTGGFVYRGGEYPALGGYYYFADFATGNFWARDQCGQVALLGKLTGNRNPSTFGQDPAGEVYVAAYDGAIYRLTGPAAPPVQPVQTPVFLPLIMNGGC